jgi:hypothetical protein
MIDRHGQHVKPDPVVDLDRATVRFIQDVLVIKLRDAWRGRRRPGWRKIGRVLNISGEEARRRYRLIPAWARKRYGSFDLVDEKTAGTD